MLGVVAWGQNDILDAAAAAAAVTAQLLPPPHSPEGLDGDGSAGNVGIG